MADPLAADPLIGAAEIEMGSAQPQVCSDVSDNKSTLDGSAHGAIKNNVTSCHRHVDSHRHVHTPTECGVMVMLLGQRCRYHFSCGYPERVPSVWL